MLRRGDPDGCQGMPRAAKGCMEQDGLGDRKFRRAIKNKNTFHGCHAVAICNDTHQAWSRTGSGTESFGWPEKNKKTHHEAKYVEGTTIVSVGAAENAYANINKFQV